jgi:hypothetical protein
MLVQTTDASQAPSYLIQTQDLQAEIDRQGLSGSSSGSVTPGIPSTSDGNPSVPGMGTAFVSTTSHHTFCDVSPRLMVAR